MAASNYPSDFQTVEGSYDPVEPAVFLGVEPMLLGLILIALLLLLALAYWLGRRSGDSEPDVAENIHRAILIRSHLAMSASSDQLKARAGELRSTLDTLLGPVLKLGKGLNGPVDKIDKALKGKVKDDHGHGGGHRGGLGGGGPHPHGDQRHDHGSGGGGGSAAVSSHVTVIGVPVHVASPAPTGPHAPEERDMTAAEQTDALGKAVRDFHDYWSQRSDRVSDLKRARAALSRRPTPADLKTDGSLVWNR